MSESTLSCFFFFFFVPSHLAGGGAIAGAGSGAISAPFRVERKVFILSCADRQQSGKRSNTSTRRTKEPGEGKGVGLENGKWEMVGGGGQWQTSSYRKCPGMHKGKNVSFIADL